MKRKVVVIVGPTSVGKTKLSVELARKFNGEVISGDSMQVYRGMDIGTAKVTTEEMQGIPHYMIDIKDPSESFTTADFQTHVRCYIDKITKKNKLPILVGGSGLYIQSALYDFNFSTGKRDEALTHELEAFVLKNGILPLYEKLKQVDPEQAGKIHPNNHRRVIRALEVYETTGKTMTQLHNEQSSSSPYDLTFVGLEMERDLLYKRINKRVDTMIANGLIDEVKNLYHRDLIDTQSMKAIGYKELIPYLQHNESLADSIEKLKQNSRRYAKRQLTWFKNRENIQWYTLTPDTYIKVFQNIFADLKGIV